MTPDTSLDIKMQDLKLSSPSPLPPPLESTPAETDCSAFPTTPLLPADGNETSHHVDIEPHLQPIFPQIASSDVDPVLPHDTASLKSSDIQADPILSALAKGQARATTTGSKTPSQSHFSTPRTMFKARPAPSTTKTPSLEPRMTKSAALRQGLDWASISGVASKTTRTEGTNNTTADQTTGHRRATLSLHIPSLAAPTLAPKATRSSQLRTGALPTSGSDSNIKRDMAAVLAANRAKAEEERLRRRRSLAILASLSAPSIAPRQNRSSALRAGIPPATTNTMQTTSTRRVSTALTATDASNHAPVPSGLKKDEKAEKRKSVVKSLGAPSIAPRLNRAAILRTAPASALTTSSSAPTLAPAPKPVVKAPSRSHIPPSPKVGGLGPKPTKSSLLRAGLGAKVSTSAA